ncbi:MAG: serpin family protein [Deltaproteobacteria bacterium]|nr:serpin family protein [Deltaproteobacteria bacterium]
MDHRTGWSSAVVLVALLPGCKADSEVPPPRPLSTQETALVEAVQPFGLDLFREVVTRSDGGNVFISPLSVSMALGMALNGAAGDTRAAMEGMLGFTGMTSEDVNRSVRDLIDLLTHMDPAVALAIANSIWYREGFSVRAEFLEVNSTWFDAEVAALDFDDPSAATAMNDWVDESTRGRITSIIAPPIDGAAVMFLINAVYFKGSWSQRFDASLTRDETFHAPAADATVPMMNVHAELPYCSSAEFLGVDLPYGEGWFRMMVLVPQPGLAVDDLVALMTPEGWAGAAACFRTIEGDLAMPKFIFEYSTSLNEVLGALGMGIAFTDAADFTGISAAGGLSISEVKHKTWVRVDEEGTEAAAATSVGIVITSEPPTFDLRVDRPFVFAIHDTHSGALLFIGKMVEPRFEE